MKERWINYNAFKITEYMLTFNNAESGIHKDRV